MSKFAFIFRPNETLDTVFFWRLPSGKVHKVSFSLILLFLFAMLFVIASFEQSLWPYGLFMLVLVGIVVIDTRSPYHVE